MILSFPTVEWWFPEVEKFKKRTKKIGLNLIFSSLSDLSFWRATPTTHEVTKSPPSLECKMQTLHSQSKNYKLHIWNNDCTITNASHVTPQNSDNGFTQILGVTGGYRNLIVFPLLTFYSFILIPRPSLVSLKGSSQPNKSNVQKYNNKGKLNKTQQKSGQNKPQNYASDSLPCRCSTDFVRNLNSMLNLNLETRQTHISYVS